MLEPLPAAGCTMEVRVRYAECDPMGYVHHSVYPVWFEMGRTELLRRSGTTYAELEARGLFIVVARLNVSYHQPARYDDLLRVTATLTRAAGVKIEHAYEVRRGEQKLCSATTVLACVDAAGRVQPVPDLIRPDAHRT